MSAATEALARHGRRPAAEQQERPARPPQDRAQRTHQDGPQQPRPRTVAAAPPPPTIRGHKASGETPPPWVLLEGEEGAGKTWELVKLSRSPRVGHTYVLEVGENKADEYGGVMPGADITVIDHDGSYSDILAQVQAVWNEAARARAAGEKPVVLGIDSFTFFWAGLKDWVTTRARNSNANKALLAQDPNAEIQVGRHLWNDASSRYNRIANLLHSFPGVVVVTARGAWVSMTDPRTGQPYRDGRKEYSVDGHKSLGYAAHAWVRMTRDGGPQLVACKSAHQGVRYEKDAMGKEANTRELPIPRDKDLLDWLIFDVMRFDAAKGHTNHHKEFTAGPLDEHERAADPEAAAPVRRGVEDALRAARAAVRCSDAEVVRETYREAHRDGSLDVDVKPALKDEWVALVGLAADAPTIPFSAWLTAVGAWVAANGGLTILNTLDPDGAPDAPVGDAAAAPVAAVA